MRQKIFAIIAMAALATAFVNNKAMAGYYGGYYGGGYYGGWSWGGYGWGSHAPYYGYTYPAYGYVVGYAVRYTYAYPAYVTYAPAYGCGCGGW